MSMFLKHSYETTFEATPSNENSNQLKIADQYHHMLSLQHKKNFFQASRIKQMFSSAQGFRKIFLTSREKQGVRKFYSNLKKEFSELLKSIQKRFEDKKLVLSEFFQREQQVIGCFFQAFVEHLKIQCKQEAQFVDFIWNHNKNIVQNVLEKYQKLEFAHELQKNTELRDTHVKYSEFMAKQAQKNQEQYLNILNLKKIIQIMVQKLRIRRKEVKKLFRETQQLISIVNEFKDKNIELEMKYLNLMQCRILESSQLEIKQIAEKKERLNYVFREILTLQKSLYTNTKALQHEVNLEGPLQAEDFIKEASGIIHGSAVSNQEIKAQIDIILYKYEEDFQDTLLRIKKTPKRKNLGFHGQEPFCQTNIQVQSGLICQLCNQPLIKPERVTRSTQITNVDKHCNNLIKSVATTTKHKQDAKPVLKSYGTQSQPMSSLIMRRLKPEYRCLYIMKTVEICINRFSQKQKKNSLLMKPFVKNQKLKPKTRAESEQNQHQNDSSMQSKSSGFNEQIFQQNLKNKKNQSRLGNKSRFSLVVGISNKNSNYFSRISSQMQRIQEEERYDSNKKIQSRRKSNMQSSSKKPGSRSRRVNLPFNNPDFEIIGSDQNVSQQVRSNQSEDELKDQILQKHSKSNDKKRSASLSRFSQFMKIKSSSKYRFSKQQNLNSQNSQQSANTGHKRKSKIQQRRLSNLDGRYGRISNYTKQSLTKGKKISKMTKQILNKKVAQKQSFVEQTIKKALQKIYPYSNTRSYKQSKLSAKFVMDLKTQARSKSKQYSIKTRKLAFFIQHNNLISIISSVYSRAFQKMNSNGLVFDLIQPLYQSMMVMYGNITKEEINKKICNFMAQVAYRKKNPICQSFAFLLGVAQEVSFEEITTFDIHLYLHIINKLSNIDTPFEDVQNAATDLQKINEQLPLILQEYNIGETIIKDIMTRIKKVIYSEAEENQIALEENKINLFSCAKLVLHQLLKIKRNIKSTFIEFLESLESKLLVSQKTLHKTIQFLSLTKIQEVTSLNKIMRISRKNPGQFDINEFSTAMLILNIQCFQDYYVKMLNKFKITNNHRRIQIMKLWQIYNKQPKHLGQQTVDVLLLKFAEEKSSELLENLIGNNLTQLFTVSILKACGI